MSIHSVQEGQFLEYICVYITKYVWMRGSHEGNVVYIQYLSNSVSDLIHSLYCHNFKELSII